MLLQEKLKNKQVILASGSPRRQQFLRDLGLDFKIRLKSIEERFPEHLKGVEIVNYLAKLKARPYLATLKEEELLITGDTIVVKEGEILHKPKNKEEAIAQLTRLSDSAHQVISSACLVSTKKQRCVADTTVVYFKKLAAEEIEFYVDHFQPYDKAGAYGIQEWIGKIGIQKIEGSFYTVMGMPVHKVYQALMDF